MRLEGAGADFHAADARYHITCYKTFTSERNIKVGTRRLATSDTLASEVAVEAVVSAVRADTDRVWSHVKLHTLYKEKREVDCNRSRLVNSLKGIIGDEITMLLSRGVVTMLTPKAKAVTVLRLDEVDQGDFNLQVKAVAGKIAAETKILGEKFLHYSNNDR